MVCLCVSFLQHSPVSYTSETDLDEIAQEMECFDNTVDIPQKPATESKEPVKLKKVVTKKKSITPKKPVSDGIKQRKSTVMLKQRSPLKMVSFYLFFYPRLNVRENLR